MALPPSNETSSDKQGDAQALKIMSIASILSELIEIAQFAPIFRR
jgi:hypothetical protein